MKDWIKKALELKNSGTSWSKLPEIINKEFNIDKKSEQIRSALRPYLNSDKKEETTENINPKEELLNLLKKESSLEELAKELKLSERIIKAYIEDLKEEGYNVVEADNKFSLNKIAGMEGHRKENWNGNKIIRFGLVSDTHLGSNAQQLTNLNKMYDIFQHEGIEKVYHSGDICDGDDVYPGHKFEVFVFGADNQKEYAIKNYPSRLGMETLFITGNHDLKYFTKMGFDIGTAIADKRKDLIYLGQYFARIELTPNCTIQLEHPLGKPAYAVSYKTQRKIDNMRGGDKPNILCEGHYHYSNYMFRRNVHAFCVPSFQGQTKFAKRLGLESDNGGYVIEINVDSEGTIEKIQQTFYPFYKPLENDY